ncbi:MAG: FTR1 family protein [Alphaproteobacteria bacterium]|nr:FTR1 family protein [Alphaproteobacteria bacterium]
MLSTALIIFREVFEIMLILSVVIAATKDMVGRQKWIYIGIGAGILGSAIVAFFTDRIANLASGTGQEIFNAGILFTASLFIAWTVLWMQKHARHIKTQFQLLGADIRDGNTPFYALSIVIALAILREGTEIVLFTFGMIATGESWLSLSIGFAIGVGSGLLIGGLLYRGLISFSSKLFFRGTSLLLILLVAGMMSQGFGYLVSAGYFESLSSQLWDSSWLLNEHGAFGQTLHALIGYTARPSAAQLAVYLTTLAALLTVVNPLGIQLKRKQQAS